MRIVRILIGVVLGVTALGLALLGKWKRALVWLVASFALTVLGALVTPWAWFIMVALAVACLVDTVVQASRPDAELHLLRESFGILFGAAIASGLVLHHFVVEA